MFAWSMFLYSVLVFVWLVRAAPATRRERAAFIGLGALLLAAALLGLFGVGPVVVVTRG